MSVNLWVKTHFDAAHHLNDYNGPCSNIHGHRWDVEAVIEVEDPPEGGYYKYVTLDFKTVKAALDSFLPDHQYLNDIFDFNPTAENLALWIRDALVHELGVARWRVLIRVSESPEAGAVVL